MTIAEMDAPGGITAEARQMAVTQPGVYDEIPEDVYHADPVPGRSLSVSGAKKLLPPSCPARFAYEREHPKPPTAAMERGTAAHKMVLGTGPRIVHIDADDWRKKATQEQGDAVRAEGGVPLLTRDYLKVHAMAGALREHPLASALFDPERGGHPEQSVFWQDARTGVQRRMRADWLPDLGGWRPVLSDYKTCASADPSAIARSVANFRYDMQGEWYADGIEAITGLRLPFLFVFQEAEPPYLITVCQLDDDAQVSGRLRNERAIERYRDCEESGIWPGYSPDLTEIKTISLPPWAQAKGDLL